jgi:hypothetical protein
VRRTLFETIGSLSSDLYPNEENEWLDRAHRAGVGAYYDPKLVVYRPQRRSPDQMGLTLLRYGMGRTRQFRVSGWIPTFHQFLPILLFAAVAAIYYGRLETEFVLLWLLASLIIALTCDHGLSVGQRLVAGLLAPLFPLTYAIGQIIGWFALLLPAPPAHLKIILRNERGVTL